GAGFASAPFDVEREPARGVSAHFGFGRFGKQFPHVIPYAGVGGRVGSGGAADRALIHVDDLVKVVDPGDLPVPAGHGAGAVEFVREDVVEDRIHQRRLSRTGDPGDADEAADGELRGNVLQVVL